MDGDAATVVAVLTGEGDATAFIAGVGVVVAVVVLTEVVKSLVRREWKPAAVILLAVGLSTLIGASFGALTWVTPVVGIFVGVLATLLYDSLEARMNGGNGGS